MAKKGGSTQTVTQGLDPGTQAHVARLRQQGAQAANAVQGMGPLTTGPQTLSVQDQISPFLNPYIGQVVGGIRGEFDHLRNQAQMATDQGATMAGAFGGSRHGVASGVRQAELDRAQTSQIAGLLHSGWNSAANMGVQYAEQQRQLQEQQMREPLLRQQLAQQFLQGSMGPLGTIQTTNQSGGTNPLGSALGGASVGSAFGPAGALIGGGLGLLGGWLS